MNIMIVINFIFALILPIFAFCLDARRLHIKMDKICKATNIPASHDDPRMQDLLHYREIAIYTSIALIFLGAGFIGLYYFSNIPQLTAITSTGIHLPIFLILIGLMIKLSSRWLVKKYDINEKMIILVCSSALAVSFTVVDYHLALYIIAIILGKYICIDFIFDRNNIKTQVKNAISLTFSAKSIEYILYEIPKRFVLSFVTYTVFYELFFKSSPVFMIFVYFITLNGVVLSDSIQKKADALFFDPDIQMEAAGKPESDLQSNANTQDEKTSEKNSLQ